ncbi:aminotransferase class I/II-fold pyridoxal phosphate-dependent enzyme [Ferrimicrobium sp.]|uniref:aminotransferase class I/II-fold pyridoxal phosphate-dependent enzyme n=1 Tax=Ferrimicrobium sp. TaxID=2926050 RepID=UPI00262CC500|nr:aminotransferase class I/II-fold pyridoxal phosphate-dependent enzyme [Ferrimicrobium sp.]
MKEFATTGISTVAMLREIAYESGLEVVDAAVGSPVDPPPAVVPRLLASSGTERHYPRSDGSTAFKEAVLGWLTSEVGVDLDAHQVGATIGSKEFISSLPLLLARGRPDRDVVLIPPIAYPSYAVGAKWAGLETYRVPAKTDGTLDLDAIPEEVARRALLFWVNSPNNPTGMIESLAPVAHFGDRHGVIIASDECYHDFGWTREPESLLGFGVSGHLALYSLSKRSNLAGLRIGMYAGDGDLVQEIALARRELGLMPPGPVQAVAAGVLGDREHVVEQRRRYAERLRLVSGWLENLLGVPVRLPDGGIYLWVRAPEEFNQDGATLGVMLARKFGLVTAPGADYGDARFLRVSMTISTKQMETLASRLG